MADKSDKEFDAEIQAARIERRKAEGSLVELGSGNGAVNGDFYGDDGGGGGTVTSIGFGADDEADADAAFEVRFPIGLGDSLMLFVFFLKPS